jgi:hypothetical protein
VVRSRDEALVAALRACADAGMSCAEAAAACGVTYNRAYDAVRGLGVKFRVVRQRAGVDEESKASLAAAVRRALRERGVVEVQDVDSPHSKVVISCALRDEVRAGRAVRLFRGVYATHAAAEAVRSAVAAVHANASEESPT